MLAINLHKDRVWQLVDEGYNRGRAAVAHEVCHPDYVNESVIRAMPRGPDGAAQHIDLSHAAITDMQVRIVDLVGEDGAVAALRQTIGQTGVGSSRVDLQACKLEYSIVSPK